MRMLPPSNACALTVVHTKPPPVVHCARSRLVTPFCVYEESNALPALTSLRDVDCCVCVHCKLNQFSDGGGGGGSGGSGGRGG